MLTYVKENRKERKQFLRAAKSYKTPSLTFITYKLVKSRTERELRNTYM